MRYLRLGKELGSTTFALPNYCSRPQWRVCPSRLPPPTRYFHASPVSRSGFIDAGCAHIYNVMELVHTSTGLHWAAAIPLSAVLVRTLAIFPVSLWAQKHINKELEINPIIHAWRPAIERKIMKEQSATTPEAAQRVLYFEVLKKKDELYKKFKVTPYKARIGNLVQLPIFLMCIETIRKMCGASEGLLGSIHRSLNGEAVQTGVGSVASSVPFVQSLGNEGALWFPSLLASDPHLLLPAMLSLTMFTSIKLVQRELREEGTELGKWRMRLHRALLGMSLAIFPAMLNAPTAMLLYWLASSVTAIGQRRLIAWILPKPVSAVPAKRIFTRKPKYTVVNEFGDYYGRKTAKRAKP